MNDIRKEVFVSKFSKEKNIEGNKMIYNILPEYGEGMFIIYEIIQGMYLSFNNLNIKNKIRNKTNSNFSSPVIKIDYCLDGSYISNCPCNRICIVKKGNTAYYVGTKNFIDVDFKGKRYQSISIFCYLDEVTNAIKKTLGISKKKIEYYYRNIMCRKNFLIVKTDPNILYKLNQIYNDIKDNNIELIKIRTIELFLLEINNYEDYKGKQERYYQKSTINKVHHIRDFIEENMQEHMTIDNLSNRFNISSTKLKQCFKDINGMGPYAYLKKYRMQTASELLSDSDYNILEIANMIGYSNQSKFSASFKKTFGITPLKYRKMQ
ncbi:helix-turn-helix transcriptional regulator [Clostridiisalibacter paucivorans]|uniref:helix-turn-helix transcriptional regulator n=1 Tax=Clostridiisalibacter paucivorans TaxID=408753 RepID=UPI00047D1DAF|nr:AraC family transcriptional regulator [Clostridiisalibacter paucivorans]